MKSTPTLIPGLRSPYVQVGGIFHFGRMLDKIRLHAAGRLPPDWVAAMGFAQGLDGRCCRLLGVTYAALQAETLRGGDDDALLAWTAAHGLPPSAEQIEYFNAFIMKMGWRDRHVERLHFRLDEVGLPRDAAVTLFDFIDLDEGRPPHFG